MPLLSWKLGWQHAQQKNAASVGELPVSDTQVEGRNGASRADTQLSGRCLGKGPTQVKSVLTVIYEMHIKPSALVQSTSLKPEIVVLSRVFRVAELGGGWGKRLFECLGSC